MKYKMLFALVLMIAGVSGLGFIAPWWAGVVWVVFIAAVLRTDQKQGMFAGGFGFAIVWIVMAKYMSIQDEADIITKTGTLLGGLSHQLMMVVTLVIAFITGLLSGWLGSVFGSVIRPKATEKV